MPSTLPSSFASAAAGMHQDGAGRNTARQDGPGFGDWYVPNESQLILARLATIVCPLLGGSSLYNVSPRGAAAVLCSVPL